MEALIGLDLIGPRREGMGLIQIIREAIVHDEDHICECRNCGVNLTTEEDICPNCESGEIVCYNF